MSQSSAKTPDFPMENENVDLQPGSNIRTEIQNWLAEMNNEQLSNYVEHLLSDFNKKERSSEYQTPTDILHTLRQAAPIEIKDNEYILSRLFILLMPVNIRNLLEDKLDRTSCDKLAHIADIASPIVKERIFHTPFAREVCMNRLFLINTASFHSFIPTPPEEKLTHHQVSLIELSPGWFIPVYGEREIEVNFGFFAKCTWKFYKTDISQPILGADFMSYYGVFVNFEKSQINKFSLIRVSTDEMKAIKNESNGWLDILQRLTKFFSKPLEILSLIRALVPENRLREEKGISLLKSCLPDYPGVSIDSVASNTNSMKELAEALERDLKARHMMNKHLLAVTDKLSNIEFLIDSAFPFSSIPAGPEYADVEKPSLYRLRKPDGSPILEYGYKVLEVDIGLEKPLTWRFIVVNDPTPRIGFDFLHHFQIIVDLQRRRIFRNPKP